LPENLFNDKVQVLLDNSKFNSSSLPVPMIIFALADSYYSFFSRGIPKRLTALFG
jgi:hypothetical protein